LQDEDARFDIGQLFRTTSDPTLAIQFVTRGTRDRFTFMDAGLEQIRGSTVRKIGFAEREPPTVVQVNRQDALASGVFWVREADGVIVRTALQVANGGTTASVTVDFERDSKLDLWVPSRMEEKYEERFGASIKGVATYSNYRRFETSARLVEPK
jgi:hypothetical protein